jgi:iron-sulfur cluster assembly accessory protein
MTTDSTPRPAAPQTEPLAGVRLGVAGGGRCGPGYMLALATSQETDDVVVEAGGIKILVAATDRDAILGAKLDYVETPMGSGFHVENPNAPAQEHGHGSHGGQGGCGCGGAGGCGGGGGCGSGGGHGGCGC